jgi:uncharacterized membrane protein YedE/YeeE
MTNFTPFASLAGGLLIGLAAALLLLFDGRIAGISGVLAGVLQPVRGDTLWRLLFLLGLVTGGVAMTFVRPDGAGAPAGAGRPLPVVALAGLLVGFGTRLGNGCTSGHGVCGLSRLSARSLVATITFMLTAALTVLAAHFLGGGR